MYDNGGNRLEKIDGLGFRKTVYHYDLEDPITYESKNNRLMYYENFDSSGMSDVLLTTTYYYYSLYGNPTRIVTAAATPVAGQPDFSATRFKYASNGQVVTYVAGEEWDADGPDVGTCPDNYTMTYAREFRYDGARQRYLVRKLDVTELANNVYAPDIAADVWADYDGDNIYGDFNVTSGPSPTLTNLRSFDPGMGMVDPYVASGNTNTKYFHGDQIGTTRATSGNKGIGSGEVVYAAFGEPFSGTPDSRYGYAGAFGYQAAESDTPATDPYVTDFKFLHVGARYYDPGTGRFLQRDPIGIKGGLNVYAYVLNRPTAGVDPTGKGFWSLIGGTVGGLVGSGLILATTPVWVTVVGVVIVVVSAIVVVDEIIDLWPSAQRIVNPIRKPVKRRNRAIDNAIDCAGMGMEDD